jgi:protease IV
MQSSISDKDQNTAVPVASSGNRDIDMFLATCQYLEIDFNFAVNQYSQYLQDIALLNAGVKFRDLGMSARREESRPKILVTSSGIIVDTWNFSSNRKRGTSRNDEAGKGHIISDKWSISNPEIPENSIAVIKLNGVMRSQSGISTNGVDQIGQTLRSAYANDNIAGVLIETNSGGGESLAGTMLKSVINERNKPVVGFGYLVASAAFRALSGADEIIMASEYCEVGSIGTMVQIDNKILAEFRDRISEFYGSDAPNKNGEFRSALAGDYSKIQKRVDELTKQFHNEIKRDRPLKGSDAKIADTLSGKMFDALEGKRRGLVDAVGTMPFAVKRILSLKSKYT